MKPYPFKVYSGYASVNLLPQICVLTQFCLWALQAVLLTFMAWCCLTFYWEVC